MCSPGDPSAASIVAEAQREKDGFLTDANGVGYIDQLWELVRHFERTPLEVVFRTDDRVYPGVAVKVWWSYGWHSWQNQANPGKSEMVFVVPDQVYADIQSRLARRVVHKHFGPAAGILVPEAIRTPVAERTWFPAYTASTTHDEFYATDWVRLLRAIQLTTCDGNGHLGGQSVSVFLRQGPASAQARIEDGQLQIFIGHHVGFIEEDWRSSLREDLGIRS